MRAPDLTGKGGATISTSDANGKARNTTGRQTVVFRKGAIEAGIGFLRSAGFTVVISNSSNPKGIREDEVGAADAIVYPKLEVALVAGNPDQMSALKNFASDSSSPILTIRDEKIRYALPYTTMQSEASASSVPVSLDYPKDYERALIERIVANLVKNAGREATANAATLTLDESLITWGLQKTNVDKSNLSGRGIRVAVLDTGIDFTLNSDGTPSFHPDFKDRTIVTQSFVNGVASAKDGKGHGTHCIGTACGPRQPAKSPRYGIAHQSVIYVGKVLNDQGAGADAWIIAGIEWAVSQGCHIISMSLGSPREPGETFDATYEEIAKRALDAGTLIIAAAGNDSARPDLVKPVGGPANCPSIMAVAALDPNLNVARFSDGGINPNGGEVNLAAPGVRVFSSYPVSQGGHERLSGTSMATPHVAGIAALYAEANEGVRGRQLWDLLTQTATQLPFTEGDVGRGLVQAPISERNSGGQEPGIVRIEEGSPIIIGGGGSVGMDFDNTHYVRDGGGGVFASTDDRLTTVQVIHQNGKLLRNFFPEIRNNRCVVRVVCEKAGGADPVTIRVSGGPNGPMTASFSETEFPFDASKELHYSALRKVKSVAVENIVTGAMASYVVPEGWAGTILIDN